MVSRFLTTRLTTRLTAAALLLSVSGAAVFAEGWSYSGAAGPAQWPVLAPDYAACGGVEQSPVALETNTAVTAEPLSLSIRWKPFHPTLEDTGHSIKVNASKSAGYATLGDEKYRLLQFHFHHGSEHTLDGRQYDAELHFVHQSEAGGLLVVGLLIEEGPSNGLIKMLWNEFPDRGQSKKISYPIAATDLLPGNRTFFRYQGSLTTPPCSEIVTWHVIKEPMTLSKEQIAGLAERYADNFRPVQQLNRRYILSGQ
ncbi:carbonic anhydrase [Coralliovum pocilloporae]|uniref:carbonic anhydrase n=1 Tax=Coralliovum pocilloporae TaxID=3066369 RepID=UPI00330722B3